MAWDRTIVRFKEGHSYAPTPLVLKGLAIHGNSGGDFGVVGEVRARVFNWVVGL